MLLLIESTVTRNFAFGGGGGSAGLGGANGANGKNLGGGVFLGGIGSKRVKSTIDNNFPNNIVGSFS